MSAGAVANVWRSSPWIDRKLSALGYAALPIVVAVGLVGALSVQSYSQAGRWRNLLTLWAPVVEQAPRAWKPYMHVAWQYYHWSDYAESAAVLDEGLPVFRAQRVYPDFMPLVYERVGKPRRALKLAAESIGRGQRVTKYKYEILLGMLARHDLPTSGGRETRRILKRAVESVTSDRRWMRNR